MAYVASPMGAMDHAFIPFSPTKASTSPQKDFFFVTYAGEPAARNSAVRRTIRSQASRSSAPQRIVTTAERRGAKRSESSSPIRASPIGKKRPSTPRYSTPRSRRPLQEIEANLASMSPSGSPDQVLMYSNALQFAVQSPEQPRPIVTPDWECNITKLMNESFVNAVLELRRRHIPCDAQSISLHFMQPSLYNDHLMLSCLELLAATPSKTMSGRASVSRSTIGLLYRRVFQQVEHDLYRNENWSIGPVLMLLAGWELSCGEVKNCEYHLTALSQTTFDGSTVNYDAIFPDQALTHCLPAARAMFSIGAPGFSFFETQGHLPSNLMSFCSSFSQCDPKNPVHLGNIRRIGLAALSCSAVSETAKNSVKCNEIHARVTLHVRLAAAIVSVMAQADFDLLYPNMQCEELSHWYAETLALESEALVGTLYDQILLWTLCVFSAAAYGSVAPVKHRSAVQNLLKATGITTWGQLGDSLNRYFWSEALCKRLEYTLAGILP